MCYIAANVVAAILESKLNSVSQDSLIMKNSHTQTEVEFIFLHGSFLTTREVPNNTRGSIFCIAYTLGKVFKFFYLEWESTFFVALIQNLNTNHSLL